MAYRVKVEGVKTVVSTLKAFGLEADDLRTAWAKVSGRIKLSALALVPKDSGALARSIRTGKGKSKAIVRAGGSSRRSHGGGVYAPIAHFGTYTHKGKGPRMFLYQAAESNASYARHVVDEELGNVIRRLGLAN